MNFLHQNSDAPRLIEAFCEQVNTETQRYHRSFRTEQGGEFVNSDPEAYLKEKGIMRLQTAADLHDSNGVAETHNQILSAMVRPALEHAPPSRWAEAYNWPCYIKNELPHSALSRITAYEALHNAKPCISHLRPFHTKCYAHRDKEKHASGSKLEPRSITGRQVAYTDSGKMFRIDFPHKHKVPTVWQVKFETLSYSSVDVHTAPLPSKLADNPATIIQGLHSETAPPTTQTTTSSMQRA